MMVGIQSLQSVQMAVASNSGGRKEDVFSVRYDETGSYTEEEKSASREKWREMKDRAIVGSSDIEIIANAIRFYDSLSENDQRMLEETAVMNRDLLVASRDYYVEREARVQAGAISPTLDEADDPRYAVVQQLKDAFHAQGEAWAERNRDGYTPPRAAPVDTIDLSPAAQAYLGTGKGPGGAP